MPNPILAITDGTTRISLITRPWQLESWTPQRAGLKGGGVRRGSPLSDGTRLVDYSYANAIDTFTLKVMHGEQDGAIRSRQELDRLLEKGRRYWVDDWAAEPVWIEARGSDETNTRYATIKNWAMPMDSNPHAQPFFPQQEEAVMNDLVLTLEHDFWQAVAPGSSSSVEVAAQQDYDGSTYGRAATADAEVYVANKYNEANLTHLFRYTTIGAVWSANQIGAGLPYDIMTGGAAGPATGDITYFGIDTTVGDSGPFSNMVFDNPTAVDWGLVGNSFVTWEYWNGAWVALTVNDGTTLSTNDQPYQSNTGVESINWINPSDWATVAVNAVTGYWVRFVITEVAAISRWQQQNRGVYSTVWPRCDVDELQVAGDLPALMMLTVEGQSDGPGSTILDMGINRVMVGLRSTDRDGTNPFQAYIPFADEQIPTGWTANVAAPHTAFANDIDAPSGRATVFTPGAVLPDQLEAWVVADADTTASYMGEFHAFLRYKVSAGADGDLRCRVVFSLGGSAAPFAFSTPQFDLLAESDWIAADLGSVILPPGGSTDSSFTLYIELWLQALVNRDATFYDIVLIPVDEWMGDYQENITPSSTAGTPLADNSFLEIDAVSKPKSKIAAPVRFHPLSAPATFPLRSRFIAYTAGPSILQANADQRLWFFMERSNNLFDLPRYSDPYLLAKLQIIHAERYQSMRGAR